MIRIASAQGFWGDWPQAPGLQLRHGQINYLVFDYLAEVTMSIMQKQRLRDPQKGYATDFLTVMGDLLPDLMAKKVRVIANAGGANPMGCAQALAELARKVVPGTPVKIGVVHGDDILANVNELPLRELDPHAPPLASLRDKLISANVYLGARWVRDLLAQDCNIIVTGRVTDTGLTLAPVMHHFGVAENDWDALATGIVAGHLLECGGQAGGGNFLGRSLPLEQLVDLAFPIAEFHSPREFFVTKHASLGGEISPMVLKEQLLYEIGDPTSYITPDVVVNFASIHLEDVGKDRVRVHGIKGAPATDSYKVSCAYQDGYSLTGTLVYSWPDAVGKAQKAGKLVQERAKKLGLKLTDFAVETVGAGACHRGIGIPSEAHPAEVTMRITARSQSKEDLERLGREVVPLVLTGPPGATGFAGGRPRASDVLAYWPGLLPKTAAHPKIDVLSV